MTKRDSD